VISLQQLLLVTVILVVAVAVAAHLTTLLTAQQQYFSLAKAVAAYADTHHVKICIYNPGPGLYATKLAILVGHTSSNQVTVIQQGEKAEVVFTFTTPLPYQLGTTVQGQIIDTQGNTYPITFTIVENVEKISC
jgi:hypothetical protein